MSKKLSLKLLLSITILFAAFLLGLFAGRNMQSTQPRLSQYNTMISSSAETTVDTPFSERGKININTAGAEDLILIPGIGQVLAQRILTYREENGPFSSVDDLLDVRGIGNAILDKISVYITVGG